MEDTRPTLLNRMKEGPQAGRAWEEFYEIYWGPIIRYARRQKLQEAEAHDVLQETMVDLMQAINRFEYNPSRGKFRNFLLTIVHRKCGKVKVRKYKRGETSWEQGFGEEEHAYADKIGEDPDAGFEEQDEKLWQLSVLEDCLDQLRKDPATKAVNIDIFIANAIEGLSADEVAERYDTNRNNVHQINIRFKQRLTTMVRNRLHGDADQ